MDKLESFRITEAELAKWEKKCEVLKKEAASSSKQETGPSCGQSNEMRITRYTIQISQRLSRLALSGRLLLHPCLWSYNMA